MNPITFPPIKVTDGAWGPCMLTLSESTGLSILSKDTEVVLENWPWREVSHVTAKNIKKRLFQVKKYTGVKKLIKLSKRVDIERFEQTLKNSVGIKEGWNIRFQRKFTLIQPKVEATIAITTFVQANPPSWNCQTAEPTISASNAYSNGSTPPPPPPPPPPMSQMPKLVAAHIKPQAIKPELPTTHGSVLSEIHTKFAGGVLKPSDIRAMVAQQEDRPRPCFSISKSKQST